jgi:hypothetical protein
MFDFLIFLHEQGVSSEVSEAIAQLRGKYSLHRKPTYCRTPLKKLGSPLTTQLLIL